MTAGTALHGVRVVMLSALGPAPYAAMLLADLGADVVRVDRPDPQTPVTGLRPEDDPRTRGQRSLGLDLKAPRGRDLLLRLVEEADVLLEGMRPRAAERLGLGPDDLLGRYPRLIYGRATGWGQDGPRALRAGHDINYAGLSGALHPIGPADRPPPPPLNLVADFGGGGTFLAIGVLAALLARTVTGRGQVVDAAMVDGAAHLTAMQHGMLAAGLWDDRRGTNVLDGSAPFYRTYRTRDDHYLAVGALEPVFYRAMLDGVGLDAQQWPQHERSRWPALHHELEVRFAARTRQEWTTVFDGVDACVTPVLSLAEAAVSDELAARSTFVTWDGVRQPAPAPRLSESVAVERPRAARCGHTDQILTDLRLDAEEIADLRREGVVA